MIGAYPLQGYRVVDLGSAWAGPMGAQLFADMGAEVIKVESRAKIDGLRLGRPMVGDDVAGGDQGKWPELQPAFHGLNRGKRSITVNLKSARGIELVKQLIAKSDVVMNNFAPGVMERLGFGYEALCAVKPDIIVVSMPGAGETGPLKDLISYAPIIHAISGLASLVGYEDEPVGQTQGAWSDALAAVAAASAAAVALYHRNQTGRGQYVEVSQWEATTHLLGEALAGYQMTGREPGPQGNRHPRLAPHGNYRCAGDDKWVSVAVASEEEWRSLCRVMGDPEWTADPKFADLFLRQQHRHELDRHLTQWTVQYSGTEIMEKLQAAGVAAMPVMNIEDQFCDPHYRERQIHVEVNHPMVGLEWIYGLAWALSETPGGVRRPAPLLGEHNEYVCRELIGLSEQEYNGLVEDRVLY